MLNVKQKSSGMSLIEITIATGLISILAVLVSATLSLGLKSYRTNRQNIRLQDKVARVVREFESSARAASRITAANGGELAFLRYYDLTSTSPTLVRYFVQDKQFKVGKTAPTGTPPNVVYPPENETIDFLVDDLANPTSLFTYYDGNNNLLAQPASIADVKMAGLDISLDIDLTKSPVAITESTKVNLRNTKKNL